MDKGIQIEGTFFLNSTNQDVKMLTYRIVRVKNLSLKNYSESIIKLRYRDRVSTLQQSYII